MQISVSYSLVHSYKLYLRHGGGGGSRQNSIENTHLCIKQPGLLSFCAHLPVCSFYLTNLGNRQPYFFLLASPNGQPSVACGGIKSTLLPSICLGGKGKLWRQYGCRLYIYPDFFFYAQFFKSNEF